MLIQPHCKATGGKFNTVRKENVGRYGLKLECETEKQTKMVVCGGLLAQAQGAALLIFLMFQRQIISKQINCCAEYLMFCFLDI